MKRTARQLKIHEHHFHTLEETRAWKKENAMYREEALRVGRTRAGCHGVRLKIGDVIYG
jgi:hypothetical protein